MATQAPKTVRRTAVKRPTFIEDRPGEVESLTNGYRNTLHLLHLQIGRAHIRETHSVTRGRFEYAPCVRRSVTPDWLCRFTGHSHDWFPISVRLAVRLTSSLR